MYLRRRRSDPECVAEKCVNGEGDDRRHRGPEECGPDDRRERMSWPRRTVEPALQVGCAKTDFGRDQKANCRAGNEKHEVLIESRKDEGAEGFRRLWPGSDCFQTEK